MNESVTNEEYLEHGTLLVIYIESLSLVELDCLMTLCSFCACCNRFYANNNVGEIPKVFFG
jgi:hypothetical protein